MTHDTSVAVHISFVLLMRGMGDVQLASSMGRSKLSCSMRGLAERMMTQEAAERPCLGSLLGLKCRASNACVCDGTSTDCLYGSVVRRSELGAWPERFMAKQRRIKPQGRATPARTTTKQMMHSENVARPGDSPGRTSAAACK